VKPVVRHWMHNGLVQLGEEKMSKSLGNLITIKEALEKYSADAIRIFVLSSHYRSPLTYTDDAPAAMERSSERFHHALRPCDNTGESLNAAPFADRFKNAMDNDLNTPQAIAALFDLAREMNRSREAGLNISEAQETLKGLGGVLGLTFQERNFNGQDLLSAQPFIQMLLDTRDKLRNAKQFELADQIRDGLAGQGIVLRDSAQGTQWQHQPGS
ncbi:MAG: class I tRNA ligase family protein, partial [Chloroflexi bacterium]|nr:class I tRNA ligase family protein [Chloroflexota bacterium]